MPQNPETDDLARSWRLFALLTRPHRLDEARRRTLTLVPEKRPLGVPAAKSGRKCPRRRATKRIMLRRNNIMLRRTIFKLRLLLPKWAETSPDLTLIWP